MFPFDTKVQAHDLGMNTMNDLHPKPPHYMVVLATSSRVGGAERGMAEMIAETSKAPNKRHWTLLLRNTGSGPLQGLLDESGVKYLIVNSAWEVLGQIRQQQPDIVMAFGLRWSLTLRVFMALMGHLPRTRGPKLVVAQRGLDIHRSSLVNVVDRLLSHLVFMYVGNSKAACDFLLHDVQISSKRVCFVPTGLGFDWFSKPQSQHDNRGENRIVIVGNNRPEKNLGGAVHILCQIIDLNWTAVIYTDHSNIESLDQLVTDTMSSRIKIVRGVTLKASDYDEATVLLQTSTSESLPRCVLEARSRGLAIVATDVGDTSDYVPTETLFSPSDLAQGARKLRVALQPTLGGSTESLPTTRTPISHSESLKLLDEALSRG